VDTVDEVIEAALVPAKKNGKAAGAKPKPKAKPSKSKKTRKKTVNAKNTSR
jgi:hypothetical protein